MRQYLSLLDYLLLAVQIVLAVALVRTAARMRVLSLTVWAAWAGLRMAAFWYLALTVSAESYGDWYIRTELIDGLLLALCAVEISAAMLPEYRRQVWQRGPVCMAVAFIVAGIIGQRTAYGLLAAETNIITGVSLAVVGFCFCLADQRSRFYQTGRALCLYLAGQLIAVQIPAWLNCDTPACLVQGTITAHIVRRAGPVLWSVFVFLLILSTSRKPALKT